MAENIKMYEKRCEYGTSKKISKTNIQGRFAYVCYTSKWHKFIICLKRTNLFIKRLIISKVN